MRSATVYAVMRMCTIELDPYQTISCCASIVSRSLAGYEAQSTGC